MVPNLLVVILMLPFTVWADESHDVQQPFIVRICDELCRSSNHCQSPVSLYGTTKLECYLTNASRTSRQSRNRHQSPRNNTVGMFRQLMIPKSKEFVFTKIIELCQQLGSKPRMSDGYLRFRTGRKFVIMVKRHEQRMSWYEAEKVCQSEGARLVKLDTQQKVEVIRRNIYPSKVFFSQIKMWIGLADLNKNNTYLWTDGSGLRFQKWHKGEPSHRHQGLDEDCVYMAYYVFEGMFWNDLNCDSKLSFICEK